MMTLHTQGSEALFCHGVHMLERELHGKRPDMQS